MENQLRMLFITPKWVLPMEDGARVATSMLIQGLTENGITVDLLCLAGSDEKVNFEAARAALGVSNIYVIRREAVNHSKLTYLKNMLLNPCTPITFARYVTPRVVHQVKQLVEHGVAPEESSIIDDNPSWYIINYEGLHAAAFSMCHGEYQPLNNSSITVYRAHNREADLWELRAKKESNFLFRTLLNFQAKLVDKFERSLIKQANGVATVSEEDMLSFKKHSESATFNVIPIGKVFEQISSYDTSKPLSLLFVGRLDWLPNKEGVSWFLEKIWEKAVAARPELKLKIVGSGDAKWLDAYKHLHNLEILGRVAELSGLYEEATAVIVPIQYGSGSRVKAIEAASYGRACIGTALGVAAGLGVRDGSEYIRVENEEEWLECLLNFKVAEILQIGSNAYNCLCQNFDYRNVAKKFLSFVLELRKHGDS